MKRIVGLACSIFLGCSTFSHAQNPQPEIHHHEPVIHILRPGPCAIVEPGDKVQIEITVTFPQPKPENKLLYSYLSFSQDRSGQAPPQLGVGLMATESRHTGPNRYEVTGVIPATAANQQVTLVRMNNFYDGNTPGGQVFAPLTSKAEEEAEKVCIQVIHGYTPPPTDRPGQTIGVADPRE